MNAQAFNPDDYTTACVVYDCEITDRDDARLIVCLETNCCMVLHHKEDGSLHHDTTTVTDMQEAG